MLERQILITDSSVKKLNDISTHNIPQEINIKRINKKPNKIKIIPIFENLNSLEKIIILNQENHNLKLFLNNIKKEKKNNKYEKRKILLEKIPNGKLF